MRDEQQDIDDVVQVQYEWTNMIEVDVEQMWRVGADWIDRGG